LADGVPKDESQWPPVVFRRIWLCGNHGSPAFVTFRSIRYSRDSESHSHIHQHSLLGPA
jgi:hypothetical protein